MTWAANRGTGYPCRVNCLAQQNAGHSVASWLSEVPLLAWCQGTVMPFPLQHSLCCQLHLAQHPAVGLEPLSWKAALQHTAKNRPA